MLRCIREHEAPGFGTIPVGSLWEDDSPYVTDVKAFEPVVEPGGAVPQSTTATVGDRGPETIVPAKKASAKRAAKKKGDD